MTFEIGEGTMGFFTADFWSALLAIVIIDLVLAGDNAIVIGLSARNLPKDQQKKVIFWEHSERLPFVRCLRLL